MKNMVLYRQTIQKETDRVTKSVLPDKEEVVEIESLNKQERKDMIKKLEGQMQEAGDFDFELAAQIRDMILEIKDGLRDFQGGKQMDITIKAMETAEEIEGSPEFIGRHGVKLMMRFYLRNFKSRWLDKCRFYSQKVSWNTLITLNDAKVVGFVSYGDFRDPASIWVKFSLICLKSLL